MTTPLSLYLRFVVFISLHALVLGIAALLF
jgi:hypothetical protein